MKCVLCEQRKGKRQCPAKRSLICAQCCGEKRVLEIDCPESCEFLKMGRHKESEQHARHFMTTDPAQVQKRRRLIHELRDFYGRVEMFIADERRSSRSLKDSDLIEALDLVLDSLRTEERGIIFARSSSNLFIDGLRRSLAGLIDSLRNPKEDQSERLRLTDAIDILECIREVAGHYMNDGSATLGYVDSIARIYPPLSQHASAGSSIIIPGR